MSSKISRRRLEIKPTHIREFQRSVNNFWKKDGRHGLPWRQTRDPYKIMVSEVMLQQTQVDRVIPYYEAFLKRFPTVQKLANAPLSEVLKLWSGLGYNRRAKYLHDASLAVVERHTGRFPKNYADLRALPGVGDYTAMAVRIFAFDETDVLIETNVRTAFTHYFFKDARRVHDKDILPLMLKAAKNQDPREWHWALMDYGSFLKKSGIRVNQKSAHYTRQTKFQGSKRQLRGRILQHLTRGPVTHVSFKDLVATNTYNISTVLRDMQREGLILKQGRHWKLS